MLIWNNLSCGDREAAAVLVALNSVFQIVAFGALGRFYLQVLPRLVRGPAAAAHRQIALYGLLFTIVMLFALQGDAVTSHPLDVVRIALPLLVCFVLMFGGSFALGLRLRLGYSKTALPRPPDPWGDPPGAIVGPKGED